MYSGSFNSKSVLNYAESILSLSIYNPYAKPQDLNFTFIIPNGALVTNFSTEINSTVRFGQLINSIKAEKLLNETLGKSTSAAVLSMEITTDHQVNLRMNIPGFELVNFKVYYEEYLPKRGNEHSQEIKFLSSMAPPVLNAYFEVIAPGDKTITNGLDSGSCKSLYRTNLNTALECRLSSLKEEVDSKGRKVKSIRFTYSYEGGEEPFSVITDDYFALFVTPEQFDLKHRKHIIFVLDVSGSMSGSGIDLTKKAMLDVIGTLSDDTYFNIVTFDSYATHWPANKQAVKAEKKKKIQAEAHIKSLRARGGTNMEAGLRAAMQLATNFPKGNIPADEKLVQAVLFMTDGYPGPGLTDPEALARMARQENAGVRIYGMALGPGASYRVVSIISERTGGKAVA